MSACSASHITRSVHARVQCLVWVVPMLDFEGIFSYNNCQILIPGTWQPVQVRAGCSAGGSSSGSCTKLPCQRYMSKYCQNICPDIWKHSFDIILSRTLGGNLPMGLATRVPAIIFDVNLSWSCGRQGADSRWKAIGEGAKFVFWSVGDTQFA